MLDSARPPPPEATESRNRLWLPALVCVLLLAVEIYALFSDFGTERGSVRGDRPVIATFKQGVNEVRSRSAGTITWTAPAPEQPLRREDALLTMKDSQALVRFDDGSELNVEPDSLVVLERSETSGRHPKIVLKLVEGSLARRKSGGSPIAIDLAGTRIEDPTGRALFHLNKKATGEVDVQVESGELKVGEGSGAKTVGSMQEATIGQGAVKVVDVPVRYTSLAPDGARAIARDADDAKIGVKWERIAGTGAQKDVKAKVLYSRHPDLSDSREADVGDDGQSAELEPDADGTWYWQVQSEDGAVKSRPAKLVVITRKPAEAATPDDDHEIIVGQPVVFSWKATLATRVYVETSASEDFASPSRVEPARGKSAVELKFDKPQTLYWRLRADYGKDVGVAPPGEARKLVVKPKPLLKAPKGFKARVHIHSSARLRAPSMLFALIELLLEPRVARAEEAAAPRSRKVTADIEWNEVEGAKQYHLQIATDEEFKHVVGDHKLGRPAYSFKADQTEKPRTLYYRVSCIDEAGDEGPFSDANEIEIEALPELAAKPEAPHLSEEEQKRRAGFHLSLLVGAAYHSRSFKSEAVPTLSEGKGMIPAFGGLELSRKLGATTPEPDDVSGITVALGASLLAEKAEPTTAGVVDETFPVPLLRGWLMLEKAMWGELAGAGLYATTSNAWSWNSRHAVSERKMIFGLSFVYASSLVLPRTWHWRAQLGLVAAGAKGADVSGSLRNYFSGLVREADHSGFFWEPEIFVRFMDIESSYGGVVKIGYAL